MGQDPLCRRGQAQPEEVGSHPADTARAAPGATPRLQRQDPQQRPHAAATEAAFEDREGSEAHPPGPVLR